jgi:hypothetical protein
MTILVVQLGTNIIVREAMMIEATRAMIPGATHVGVDGGIAGMNANPTTSEALIAQEGITSGDLVARVVLRVGFIEENHPSSVLLDVNQSLLVLAAVVTVRQHGPQRRMNSVEIYDPPLHLQNHLPRKPVPLFPALPPLSHLQLPMTRKQSSRLCLRVMI